MSGGQLHTHPSRRQSDCYGYSVDALPQIDPFHTICPMRTSTAVIGRVIDNKERISLFSLRVMLTVFSYPWLPVSVFWTEKHKRTFSSEVLKIKIFCANCAFTLIDTLKTTFSFVHRVSTPIANAQKLSSVGTTFTTKRLFFSCNRNRLPRFFRLIHYSMAENKDRFDMVEFSEILARCVDG